MPEDTQTKPPIPKESRIKKEINRLKKLYKDMEPDTMKRVIALINNAAFMTITLEDLQLAINKDGGISKYQNGENQFGTKKSPEVEIYNTMIKNLASIIKQLTDLTPIASLPNGPQEGNKPEDKKDKDDFDTFADERDDK